MLMASTLLVTTLMCLAPFQLLVPAVAGVSAINGVHAVVDDSNVSSAISVARSSVAGVSAVSADAGVSDVVGGPNVSCDLSVAGDPAAVRVSRVEPVAVVTYTRTFTTYISSSNHMIFFCFDYRTSGNRINGSKISNDWIFSLVKIPTLLQFTLKKVSCTSSFRLLRW
jgi:hypothetical protein